MKQHFKLTCLALAGAFPASVSAATLYALDFNTLGDQGGIAFSNSGSGTTPVQATSGFNNYNPSTPDSSAFAHSPHGGTFSIQNDAGIGANTSEGFTIELDFRHSYNQWADLFSITVGGYALKFEKAGASGDFRFYNDALTPGGSKTSSALDGYSIPFSLTADTWSTMRIEFKEQTAGTTTIAFYKDGSLAGSTTSTELVGNLTGIRGGANAANNDAGTNWLMDNFTVSSVPEPSSAALLGLGGLALILRRRK